MIWASRQHAGTHPGLDKRIVVAAFWRQLAAASANVVVVADVCMR